MAKFKKKVIKAAAFLSATSMVLGICAESFQPKKMQEAKANSSYISKADYSIDTKVENFYDENVVFKLSETLSENDEVSIIVSLNSDAVIDVYNRDNTSKSLTEYAHSREGKIVASQASIEQNKWLKKLDESKISYTLGAKYDTILNGFEVIVKAKDFKRLEKVFSTNASLIVGETYMPAESQLRL